MKQNKILILSSSVLAAFGLNTAQAQDQQVKHLDAITVQAKQFQELTPAYEGEHLATGGSLGLLGNLDNMETPFSTINYTSTYIEDLQGQELRILISKNDPSVQTPGSGGTGGKDTLYIRGFSASDVYLNGLQGLTSGRRVMAMAERLEILKGPASMLYGMNAGGDVGGSINLVTKRATAQPINTLTATYMNPSQFGGHVDLGRRLGEEQEFGIRLNAVHKNGEGMVKRRKNRDTFVALGLDLNKGPIRLEADIYHINEYLKGINRGINFAKSLQKNPLPPAPKGDLLLGADWADATTKETTALLRGEYDVNTALSTYASFGYSQSEMYNYNNKGTQLLNAQGDAELRVTRRHNKAHTYAGNIGGYYVFDTGPVKHNISFGFDWSRKHNQISNTAYNDPITGKRWGAHYNIYRQDYPERPVFAQGPLRDPTISTYTSIGLADTLSFMDDQFSLTLGIRQQWVKENNKSNGSRYDSHKLTPAIAGVWRISQDWMAYTNYIEGLSKGSVVSDDYENEGEVFAPQATKQHEVGIKYDSGNYAISMAAFSITQPTSFESPPAASGLKPTLSYAGQQRNQGVELQAIGQITQGLRLTGGVAYLNPKVHKTDKPELKGKTVRNLSRWVGKAGVEWDPSLVAGLTFSAHVSAQSKQYLDADNTWYVPGVTTYDLGARYQTKLVGNELTLRFSVENVTNKAYWVAPLNNGAGTPRTFLASATLRF